MSELEITGIPDGLTSWRGRKERRHRQRHHPGRGVPGRRRFDGRRGDARPGAEPLGGRTIEQTVLAKGFAAEIAAPEANWMVQPTINSAPAGFVSTRCALNERTARTPEVLAAADKSLSALTGTGRLGSRSTTAESQPTQPGSQPGCLNRYPVTSGRCARSTRSRPMAAGTWVATRSGL